MRVWGSLAETLVFFRVAQWKLGPPFPSPSQAVLDSTKDKVKANCTFLEGRGRCRGSRHDLWAQIPATCRLCELGQATQPLSAPVSPSVNGDIGTCL